MYLIGLIILLLLLKQDILKVLKLIAESGKTGMVILVMTVVLRQELKS
jgi:hypothetical protein